MSKKCPKSKSGKHYWIRDWKRKMKICWDCLVKKPLKEEHE